MLPQNRVNYLQMHLQHHPCCPVTAQAEQPFQPKSAEPSFLICHPPHRPEPNSQRLVAILKNCSCCNSSSHSAPTANYPSTLCHPSPMLSTLWTDKTLGPPQLVQKFTA